MESERNSEADIHYPSCGDSGNGRHGLKSSSALEGRG